MQSSHEQCCHQMGLSRDLVEHISSCKKEPAWMLDFRMKAFELYSSMGMPKTEVDLTGLDLSTLCFYCKPFAGSVRTWNDLPGTIKDTFDKLGIPQAEQEALAGVAAQVESEVLYESIKKQWGSQGVIFCSMDNAVKLYPDLVKKYLGSLIPAGDNSMAALNSAVWSGGSFVYVPKGIKVELPVAAYFRVQAERMGQFERTLVIAEEGSSVHYIEGCSAPLYSTESLHSAVVEIFVADRARVRYTTIQNWSTNLYNLVTKRAIVGESACMEWVDGNFGSAVTMKYPCMILKGKKSRGLMMSMAVAGGGQNQHTGAKVVHEGAESSCTVISKSICHSGGAVAYVGTVKGSAPLCKTYVQCDTLMLDDISRATARPKMGVSSVGAEVGHEARVSSLDEMHIAYMASRGINAQVARVLLINGFAASFVNELPMEYAVELNRLIMLEMERSIG